MWSRTISRSRCAPQGGVNRLNWKIIGCIEPQQSPHARQSPPQSKATLNLPHKGCECFYVVTQAMSFHGVGRT